MADKGPQDIQKLLGILFRRKWLIAVIFLAVSIAGTVYAIGLPALAAGGNAGQCQSTRGLTAWQYGIDYRS